MKSKKKYTQEEIKNLTESIERVESDSILTDVHGNRIDIIEATEQAERDAEEMKKWGGKRPNSGRKKLYPERVALNKRVSKDTVIMLKDYSKKHNISENEALDRLVHEGYEHLKEA